MMPTATHLHTFKHMSLMNPSQHPLFTFMSSFRTCIFEKIQEHFGDQKTRFIIAQKVDTVIF